MIRILLNQSCSTCLLPKKKKNQVPEYNNIEKICLTHENKIFVSHQHTFYFSGRRERLMERKIAKKL